MLKLRYKYLSLHVVTVLLLFTQCGGRYIQPELEARKTTIITQGRYLFKDLNKNGLLDPYEDWRLSAGERIENLVSLMTIEEKVGLMFHPNVTINPDSIDILTNQIKIPVLAQLFLVKKKFRCLLNNGVAEPKAFAEWSNQMQEIAEASRLGIPVMFSSDPRHGAILGAHVSGKQYFSQWPGKEGYYGIAASRDTGLVRLYGEVTAEEYRAVGLHMLLGPQIDVTTEPRWKRDFGSFSESAGLTTEMLNAFMDGAQGSHVGPEKILVMLKHWPGSGPHKGGGGDWLVYPGSNFEYHLMPWKAGIAKGALAVMGYYSGTYIDTLGINYSKYLSTEVLYNQLRFKGAICTDWFVIGRKGALRPDLVGIPLKDRFEMSINAGVDQFGGESVPEFILELVKEGRITEERINEAARRILQWHFKLGLFEDPYVDPGAAVRIVQSTKNQKYGYRAQLESIVLLTNNGKLPGAVNKLKLYVSGMDTAIAKKYARIINDPGKANLILVKVTTEAERVSFGNTSENLQEVNIQFPQKKWDEIKRLAATGVPVVVAFNLSGALVVLPPDLKTTIAASLMIFDVFDEPLLDVVFGKFNPVGRLPFELPSSMDAVRKQLEDVPFDSENPAFKFGAGLSYP
jgi:beta-glucosidase